MKAAVLLIAMVLLFGKIETKILFTSCARMDVPGMSKAAQGLCISSCKFQNCGTGHCEKRSGRPVCVCSRCDVGGGSWPSGK
ncbi:unnamed protein product [Enterobius vermicularis]|uniref:INVERT_DEFENSINS domain-containing protein n=1 Tax=Enterobius vermicularis TaxID=51028 RepID=A0A0N4VKS9_ENTVE|nr:unnamed protein product [Enterobius vermicularis]